MSKNKVKKFEETLLNQIKVMECLNKEITKNKVPKPTNDAAPAEITTKITTDNTVEITIKCKECDFTGHSWNELTEHKWTDCSEALIKRLLEEDAERDGIQEVPQEAAQEGARKVTQQKNLTTPAPRVPRPGVSPSSYEPQGDPSLQ